MGRGHGGVSSRNGRGLEGRGQMEWEWPMRGGVSMSGGVATRGRGHVNGSGRGHVERRGYTMLWAGL